MANLRSGTHKGVKAVQSSWPPCLFVSIELGRKTPLDRVVFLAQLGPVLSTPRPINTEKPRAKRRENPVMDERLERKGSPPHPHPTPFDGHFAVGGDWTVGCGR